MKSPIILRIFKKDQLLEVKQFESDQIIFGHDADVTVDLNDVEISPIHCLVELRDSGYYLCDMGSISGTKKNGKSILDEPISSGDNIELGPFRIHFFVGAPKVKIVPPSVVAAEIIAQVAATEAESETSQQASKQVAEAVENRSFEVVKPQLPKAAGTHDQAAEPVASFVNSKKSKSERKATGTFAPANAVGDLKKYLKPTKGPTVEVIVAWQNRILSTYHFTNQKKVNIGSISSRAEIQLPTQFLKGSETFLELTGGCRVLVPAGAFVELHNQSPEPIFEADLAKLGKLLKVGVNQAVRLDQGEILCLSLQDGAVQIFVRYVPNAPIPLLAGPIDFSAGELTGLIVSLVIVSLTALYMAVYSPRPSTEEKPDDQVRLAQFIYDKTTTTTVPNAKLAEETKPPSPVEPVKPPPELKKIKVTEDKKEQKKAGSTQTAASGKAAEVMPKPNSANRPKKFTSVKQGGATKLGETAGANAQSADVNKMGLLSAFGGGGVRKQLDQAYSGSGELLGMANQATGRSGQNENREGDDIGSKFKDTGAGAKGTATQGIAGVGTKGRGSGMGTYGAGTGSGEKGNVSIDPGGADESWEGTIDREAVRRVIRSILSQIKSCYERQLRSNSSLEGKVIIQFEIIEQGRVRTAKAKSTTMNDATVESCVAARIKEARFPEPPAGTVAVVDYPFVFGAQK